MQEDKKLNLEEEIVPLEAGDFEELTGEPVAYEVGYHLLPSLDEDEVSKTVQNFRSAIEKKEGVVLAEEAPKRILLAYEIDKVVGGRHEKFNQAYFGWMKFRALGGAAKDIQGALATEKNMLRFLIARTVEEDTLLAGRQFLRSEQKDKEKKAGGQPSENAAEKAPLSEEELDRSLEKLIAE